MSVDPGAQEIDPLPRHGRVAMISVHTSPLDQPGTGDAGGMNVYVVELSKRLAAAQPRGRDLHARHLLRPAADRRGVPRGDRAPRARRPVRGAHQGRSCPAQLCAFAREVLRAEAGHDQGWYDLVHSHYWLSGQVGALVRDRWSVPLVHTMHTMAKVKNDSLAARRHPRAGRPRDRRGAGRRGRRHADREHRHRGQAADRAVRRRPGSRRGGAPRRRPRRVPPVDRRARARLGLPRRRGGADVRRPHPAAEGSRRAAARRARAARARPGAAGAASSSRSSAVPRAPAWSTPSRSRSSPRRSASPTWCASCRRWPSRRSRDWYAAATLVCVPVLQRVLRAGRRRGAGGGHAGGGRRRGRADAPSCATACPACSSRATTRPTTPARWSGSCSTPAPAGRAVARSGRPGAAVRLGAHRRPDPRGLPGGRAVDARRPREVGVSTAGRSARPHPGRLMAAARGRDRDRPPHARRRPT